MSKSYAAALFLVVLLGACVSDAKPDATAASSSETTTTTTSTTVDPLVAAQQAYFVVSGASNTAGAAVEAQFGTGFPLRKLPEWCAALAPSIEKFAQDLSSYKG